jgi:hypothetical protein
MGLWQSLTRRREIPEGPTWVAAAALLFFAAYAGWAAVRPEGPPVTENRVTADVLQDSRELIAHGEALMQAMRDNDQRQVEQLKEELVARSRREAEREGKRAAAVKAARTWYGVIAALNFAVGAWLLVAARKSQPE